MKKKRRNVEFQPPPPTAARILFTSQELEARWRVSAITLRRWRKEGRFRVLKIGRSVRITIDEVQRVEAEAAI